METLPLTVGMPQWMGWLYGAIAAVAAFTDYRTGKIYNWLTLPALALGLSVAAVAGWSTAAGALKGAGLAAAIFFPLYLMKIFGAGDVKLMMALGTVLGASGVFFLSCVSILIAGAGAVALLFVHKRARGFLSQLALFFRALVTPGLQPHWPKLRDDIKAPFGIAIFLALVFVLAGGSL